jgi:hypothetical protein
MDFLFEFLKCIQPDRKFYAQFTLKYMQNYLNTVGLIYLKSRWTFTKILVCTIFSHFILTTWGIYVSWKTNIEDILRILHIAMIVKLIHRK